MDIALTILLIVVLGYYLYNRSNRRKSESSNQHTDNNYNGMKYGKWVGGGLGWALTEAQYRSTA